ncbi:uncharacterized protein LOC124156074 [Ischnura elegans]|uniref:uncharacterized protein LOC124156074 n=1 Tax=Ischnura elegans TaxID=197161 RepID=UPI001ED8AE65|nr:uncharacterized protein LOC124156074 [Ischnura elegans]
MEETHPQYYDHVSERIRRILAIVVSVLLCLSAAVLVVVGMQSITALAAVFTLFALSIVFVLGVMGIGRACCCRACDGPIKRSFWFMGPSNVSLVTNSMRGSTRDSSIVEIPYPHSTDLPSWVSEQSMQPPPDYFTVTRCSGPGCGVSLPHREETPPPSYKFLHEAGLIQGEPLGESADDPPLFEVTATLPSDISLPTTRVPLPGGEGPVAGETEPPPPPPPPIIKDEDKPQKGDALR